MIFKLKNISNENIVYGDLNISSNSYYTIYNDELNKKGIFFSSFENSFSSSIGINYHIHNGFYEYYEDDILKTSNDFYIFWETYKSVFANIEEFNICESMLVKNPTAVQIENSKENEKAIIVETYNNGSNGDNGTTYLAVLTPIDYTATTTFFCTSCNFDTTDINIIKNSKIFKPYSDINVYKIYSLLSDDAKARYKYPNIAPHSINYKTDVKNRLYPKYTFNKGILVMCEYFENMETTYLENGVSTNEYSNPVLKCEFEYYTGNTKYVDYRICKRYWQTIDNNYSSDAKITYKYYTKDNARKEGSIRRQNIIEQLVCSVVYFVLLTEPSLTNIVDIEDYLMPFFDKLDTNINKFIKGNINELITEISTIDETIYEEGTNNIGNWLSNIIPDINVSIRDYCVNKLNEGRLDTNTKISL